LSVKIELKSDIRLVQSRIKIENENRKKRSCLQFRIWAGILQDSHENLTIIVLPAKYNPNKSYTECYTEGLSQGPHDTQHIDNQHNNKNVILSKNVKQYNDTTYYCCNVLYHYAECHSTE
jgi:hypothetical protein